MLANRMIMFESEETTKKVRHPAKQISTSLKPILGLITLLATSAIIGTVQGFKNLNKITTSPSVVQGGRVDLSFSGQPDNPIPRDAGWIQITPPKGMSIYENGLECADIWQEAMRCFVEYKFINGRGAFRITSEADITDYFSFTIMRAIDNPESTAPTRPFGLLTSDGESQTAGRVLELEATPGTVRKFMLTPKSKTVGESTILEVRLEPGNKIPQGAFIVMSFPAWNQPSEDKPGLKKNYIQGSEKCNPVAVAHQKVVCHLVDNELVMEGAAAAAIQAGSEIVIEVAGFRNPIETGQVGGFKIQTEVRRGGIRYPVDLGVTSLSVSEYAQLSQARIEVEPNEPEPQGVIQSKNVMRLQFYLPVPLNKGCQVTVQLPEQYDVRTIKRIRTLNFFGNVRSYTEADNTLKIDRTENLFKIMPCKDYRDNKSVALIIIERLKHYKYVVTTDSFRISIKSAGNKKIARIQQGVAFKPKMGTIELIKASATNEVVSAKTMITFVLRPQHAIYVKDNPALVIQFPSAVKVANGNCKVLRMILTSAEPQDPPKCKRFNSGSGLIIPDFLPMDYLPDSGRTITIEVGDIQNPESTFRMKGLQILTKANNLWPIDEVTERIPWNLVTGTFEKVKVETSPRTAYMKDMTYRIAFNPQHRIPHNGYIEIQFPKEVLIPDRSFSQSQCTPTSISGFPNDQIICEFTKTHHDKFSVAHKSEQAHTLLISNAFRRSGGQERVEYALTIPGIQNPIRTDPTESFKFATFTRNFKSVDWRATGAIIQMIDYAKLKQVVVALSSYTNSESADYTFTLVPTVPIKKEYSILISFPEQVTLPETLKCTSEFIASLKCSHYTGKKIENLPKQTIQIELMLEKEIKSMDRFSIKVHGVTNPMSTETTDTFQVIVVDNDFAPINIMREDIVVTTSNAFTVSNAEVSAKHSWPGVTSEFTIEFTPEHKIDQMGGILLVYPPQITPSDKTKKEVQVNINGIDVTNGDMAMNYDRSARSFTILNVVQKDDFQPSPTSKITLKVKGLRNPFSNKPSDSFKIYTFNTDGNEQFFFIDKADKGLNVFSKCQYPCKTCKENEPDVCTACFETQRNQTDGLKYLQLGKCVKKCALSRFYSKDSNNCEKCDSTCLACKDTATNCVDCGIGDHLYLHQSMCKKSCPEGFLEDSNQNQCVKCSSRCKTCDQRTDKCTSCKLDTPFKLFYKDSCTEACPNRISVEMDDKCLECDGSCKHCENLPSNCVSCAEYMKLDPIRHTCSFLCEPERQIFSAKKKECQNCAYPCDKCEETIDRCTSCQNGYLLNRDAVCRKQCPETNQVPIDGVCKECEEPCATCSQSTKKCTSCQRNYLLFKGSQCVQYCPDKYKNDTLTNPTKCIYEGLVCPKGFRLNDAGDGCIPTKYQCEKGYEINKAKTACIPKPGTAVPFPFILSAIFLGFLVLGSYMKDPVMTKPLSCLVGLIGPLELLMYLSILYNAAYYNTIWSWIVFILVFIATCAAIASNLIFFIYFKQDIAENDAIYTLWIKHFPKTKVAVPLISLIVNYKFFKMIYSGFFGLEVTTAQFEKHQKVYRLLRMVQYFNFVFTYGFVFIADLIIFAYLPNINYQLFILCIESIILQSTILVLTLVEMNYPSKVLFGVSTGQYVSLKPTDGDQQMNVGAGIDQFEDYDEGIPDIDEVTLIRTRAGFEEQEINMRKQALVKILNQVSSNFQNAQQKGADLGGDINDVLTKFEPDKIKLRRAFSFAHFSDYDSWRADGDSSDEERVSYGHEGLDSSALPYDDGSLGDGMNMDPNSLRRPERRYSWPLHRDAEDVEMDPEFLHHVEDIKLAAEDYLIDNVYTDIKPKDVRKEKRKVKTVSRRTQTYLRELLTLDGEELQESDMEVLMEEEAEIEQGYAAGLINDVIEHLSDEEESRPPSARVVKPKTKPVQQQKVPDFELEDIMGEFEIDDLGNFIIIRGPNGELMDKRDRRVNRRGYLVDRFGNVINRKGDIIFKAVELDVDDEIPAPFGFEKRKAKLMQLAKENTFKIEDAKQDISSEEVPADHDDDEEMLDRELQDIRNANRESMSMKQSRQSRSRDAPQGDSHHDQQFEGEDEGLESAIDEATRRKVPRKRSKLRGGKHSGQKYNNPPPRRIRAEDTNHLFPMIGIENEEQRRLAKIAHSIGGMARDLATQQQMRDHQALHENELSGVELEEARRLDAMRQQQLRELTQDGNIASLNEDFAKIEQERRSFMLQERPNANNSSFQRIKSAVPLNVSKQESFNERQTDEMNNSLRYRQSAHQGDGRNELQKVYGNIIDLTNLEEQHLTDLMIQRRGVGGSVPFSPAGASNISAHRGPRRRGEKKRVRGLENIYLKKFNKSRMHQLQQSSGQQSMARQLGIGDPFRPLMGQFADDPAELIAETQMSEVRGIEPSVVMADRIDHIKRQYLSSNAAAQGIRPNSQAHLQMFGPPQPGQMADSFISASIRQPNATAGLNEVGSQRVFQNADGSFQPHNAGAVSLSNYDATHLEAVRKDNWIDGKQEE